MNPDLPRGAVILLDFIYRTETGKGPADCYGVIYGHNQGKLPKPLTSRPWTRWRPWPSPHQGLWFSAAAAPQFMRDTLDNPGTLLDLEGEMGLSGKELF